MSHRDHLFLTTTLLLLIIAPQSILGQTETVTLQLKLTPGEALYYAETGSVQATFESSAAGRRTSEGRYESLEAIRVLEAGVLGSMVIESTSENYRETEEGKTTDRLLPAFTFRVEPEGKIVERFVPSDERVDFPFALPGKPVRVGEAWTRQSTFTSGTINVKGTGTFTLAGLGAGAGGRTARVSFTTEGVASSGGTVLGFALQTRETTKITGEYEWLIEKGRYGRYSSELTRVSNVQLTIPGVLGLVRASAKGVVRGEPVAPESVVPPATPQA